MSTNAIASGDFDGDGDVDLVYGIDFFSPILVDNRDGGVFVAIPRIPYSYGLVNPRALAVGDVDADGDLDIVAGGYGTQNRLYRNSGNGFFVDATASLPVDNDGTVGLALVDVDADGDLDLFCANEFAFLQVPVQARLYRNDGTGTFTDVTATALPNNGCSVFEVVSGDLDGDGDVDLLMFGACGGLILYRNDGTGRFVDTTAVDWPTAAFGRQLLLADLDRDGDLDAAGLPSLVAMNLTRQLHAPFPAQVGRRFELEVWQRGAASPGLALPFLSTTRLGGVTTALGVLGIAPTLLLPPVVVPQPGGTGTLQFMVPAAATLVGSEFHAQALLWQSPAAVHLTNVTSSVILP